MRKFFLLALIGLTGLFVLSCQRNKVNLELDLQEKELSNGLKVFVVEDHSVPIVSYQTWVKVGAVDEEQGKTGLAHLFEHLMFKGTEKFPAGSFSKELEQKGAEVNAFTVKDYTVFYENFVPHLLEKVVELEADRLRNLTLAEDKLLTERQVVLEERRLRVESSPDARLQEVLWRLVFQTHPYGNPTIGYPQDLFKVKIEDLKDFYDNYYQPSNVAVVVVGDVQAEVLFDLIEKYYSVFPKKEVKRRKVELEMAQDSERQVELKDSIAAEKFAIGYPISSGHDEESYALDLLEKIVFSGTASRVYQNLIETEILLSISSAAYTPNWPGIFMISGTMRKGHQFSEARDKISEIISEIAKKGVSEEEYQMAIRKMSIELLRGVETASGLAQFIGLVETILKDGALYERELNRYFRVKKSEIKKVAEKYFDPNHRSVVIMKPEQLGEEKK